MCLCLYTYTQTHLQIYLHIFLYILTHTTNGWPVCTLPINLRSQPNAPYHSNIPRPCVCSMYHMYIPVISHVALSCLCLPDFLQVTRWRLAVVVARVPKPEWELSGFARVNKVTSASLGYPLSVFNKNCTLKSNVITERKRKGKRKLVMSQCVLGCRVRARC